MKIRQVYFRILLWEFMSDLAAFQVFPQNSVIHSIKSIDNNQDKVIKILQHGEIIGIFIL